MAYRETPICAFVDHTNIPMVDLGNLLQSMNTGAPSSKPNKYILATCQRYEIYANTQVLSFPYSEFHFAPMNVRFIAGEFNVAYRIACIASGTESLLLGERFIPMQVEKAIRNVAQESALMALFKRALSVAAQARQKYNFFASGDYTDIAYELLRKAPDGATKENLVVLGSGMMGRALAEHHGRGRYKRTFAVSRWPKELQQKISLHDVMCLHPENLLEHLGQESFDLILAISTITPEYRKFLDVLLNSKQLNFAVDLSTVSAVIGQRPKNYIHEYDVEFCRYLEAKSSELSNLKPSVQAFIADVLSEAFHD